MLVEGLPVVAYLDTSGLPPDQIETTAWVSPRIQELTGYSQREWLDGRLWRSVVHPDDRNWVLGSHEAFVVTGDDHWECEYRMLTKTGVSIWVHDSETVVRDDTGDLLQRQGCWEDITQRVEAQEHLRRSEQLYRLMAESVPDAGFALFDRELRYRLAAGPVFRAAGTDPAALEGTELGSTGHEPEQVTQLRELVRRALKGQSGELDMSLSGRCVRSHVGPVTVDGEITGALVMSLDVTDQEHLAASHRVLAQSFPGGIALFDSQLRYTSAAGRLLAALGTEAIAGAQVGGVLGDPWLADAARAALQGRTVIRPVTRSGVEVELEFSPARDLEGTITGGVLVARDVTERNAVQAALMESEQRREQVLAAMLRAEDEQRARIATDLHDDTVQVMTAALLSLDRITGAIQRGEREVALTAATAYRQSLVQAMERTRRLMFELRPPALVTAGLAAALDDLLDEASRETGFAVHLDCPRARFGDTLESLVYRAMAEGVVNVRKHAAAANVWLDCQVRSDHLDVTLRDDGRGFSEAELADAGRRRLHLGLDSIAERVRLAGGRFAIHSTPGEGTQLELSLPLGNGTSAHSGNGAN